MIINDISRTNKHRIWELDFIRGICIFLLVFYNLSILITYFFYHGVVKNFSHDNFLYIYGNFFQNLITCGFVEIVRHIVLVFFFLISGISSTFSKNISKRIIYLIIFYLIIAFIEFVLCKVTPFTICQPYGVFLAYAFSLLVIRFLLFFNSKKFYILLIVFLTVSIILFAFFPKFSISPFQLLDLEKKLCLSHDKFPIFHVLTISLVGLFLGKTVYRHKTSIFPYCFLKKEKFFLLIGRYTLKFYFVSSMIITYVFLTIVSYF